MGLVAQAALVLSLGVSGWHDGRAVYYNPGVMERVSAARGMPAVSCMVAHPTQPIGAWIAVSGRTTLVCRITDTSQPQHRARHIKLGLVELDYRSAHKLCPTGWTGNSSECPIRWKKQ